MTIDWWTLGLQAVNVLVLIWLLERFFWHPVAAVIAERRAAAERTMAEADAARRQAALALAEIERQRSAIAQEREAILASTQEAAERARTASMAEALKETASLESAARAAIENEKAAVGQAWTERAGRLAIDIAERLAARLDGPTVRGAFFNWLLAEIRILPDPTRQAVAKEGAALEAISAAPLAPAEQERYRALIGEAFGAHPQIAFHADPALIAGFELRGAQFVVENSWRADLTRILGDLSHDDRH